jgi:hypothetical protein
METRGGLCKLELLRDIHAIQILCVLAMQALPRLLIIRSSNLPLKQMMRVVVRFQSGIR